MKRLMAFALGAAVALAAPTAANADFNDNKPITITTAGISSQGFFKVVVESLHALYRDAYPGSSVTFKPGSIAGGMVQATKGEADIIPAIPPVEYKAALDGTDPFSSSMKGKFGHLFSIMNNLDFYFIATKAWADKNGIKTIADIARVKPKGNYALSAKGTFYINVAADEIFKTYGFSSADLEKWGSLQWVASGPMIDDMRDGKVDFFIVAGFHPDQRLADLAKTREVVWISVDPATLKKVADKLDMSVFDMPKSMYAFMTKDEPSLRAGVSYAAATATSEETAYKITKAVWNNIDRVKAIHPSFKEFSRELMVSKFKIADYHPGAAKFYREQGVLK